MIIDKEHKLKIFHYTIEHWCVLFFQNKTTIKKYLAPSKAILFSIGEVSH